MTKLIAYFQSPANPLSLVFYRLCFGIFILIDVFRYFSYGWVESQFILPKFHFTYWGFSWVKAWPEVGMNFHFVVLGILGVMVSLGLFYRIASILLFIFFTYIFLVAKSYYLNHFYFICLLAFINIFISPHYSFSLDNKLNSLPNRLVPRWNISILQFQMGVVYFFGGVAKVNSDWLSGLPLELWLSDKMVGPWFAPLINWNGSFVFISWIGLLIDLFALPLLMWKRSRVIMFLLLSIFHISNSILFKIGIFPWLSLALSTIYFSADWPKVLFKQNFNFTSLKSYSSSKFTKYVVITFVVLNCIIPLRQWLYQGHPHWTEEGHRFSWRMKLRTKSSKKIKILIIDNITKKEWLIGPRNYLNNYQLRKLSTHPDLMVEFAHHLKKEWIKKGYTDVQVQMQSWVSLNNRPHQKIIKGGVDLTKFNLGVSKYHFIKELKEPLDF